MPSSGSADQSGGATEQSSAPPQSGAAQMKSSEAQQPSSGSADTSGGARERSSAPPGSSAAEPSKPNPSLNSSQQNQSNKPASVVTFWITLVLSPALAGAHFLQSRASGDRGSRRSHPAPLVRNRSHPTRVTDECRRKFVTVTNKKKVRRSWHHRNLTSEP
jgi:hypothetical protein